MYGMTLKGVFFLLGQYIYGGNCYFVNGPTLSRSAAVPSPGTAWGAAPSGPARIGGALPGAGALPGLMRFTSLFSFRKYVNVSILIIH